MHIILLHNDSAQPKRIVSVIESTHQLLSSAITVDLMHIYFFYNVCSYSISRHADQCRKKNLTYSINGLENKCIQWNIDVFTLTNRMNVENMASFINMHIFQIEHTFDSNRYGSFFFRANESIKMQPQQHLFFYLSIANFFLSNFLFVLFMLHLFSMGIREFSFELEVSTALVHTPSYALLKMLPFGMFLFYICFFSYLQVFYSIRFNLPLYPLSV